ncbi:MAG: sulfotransferase domain-containing protein [Pseudomonadota bacterium]
MALPNLAVVGFPKCGSTSIFHEFKQVPDILTTLGEESTAFTGPMELENSAAMLEVKFYGGYTGQRYLADIHPALVYSKADLERLRETCGALKVICLLRDPLKRALSSYYHALRWLAENRSIKQAFDDDLAHPVTSYQFDGRTLKHHLSLSRYDVFIPHLWDIFGRENVLCLEFEDYFSASGSDRRRLVHWLGLDASKFPKPGQAHHNAGANWVFKAEESVSLNVGGQRTENERFVGIINGQTGQFERYIIDPSAQSWDWFKQAQAAVADNEGFDPSPYQTAFEDTLRFCQDEVFNRAMERWGRTASAKAA